MLAMLMLCAGCASVSSPMPWQLAPTAQQRAAEVEPMLTTAGFQSLPATTAEQKQRLQALPSLKLGYYLDREGRANYWMADPKYCGCLYHGDQVAYRRYQQLEADNLLAERDRQTLQAEREPPLLMGPFGSPGAGFGFGPGMGFGFGPGFGYSGGFGFSL